MATLWFLARKVPVFFAPVESEKIIWETSGWSGLDGIHPDTPEGSNCPPPLLKVVTGNSGNTTRHMVTGCDAYATPQYVVQVPLNFPSLQTILKAMFEIVSVEI